MGEAAALIGQILDERYRILRKLGAGGMGEVYQAEHISLGREDALKILRAELNADPEFVARFRREARATNRLAHPNIVSIHDFGKLSDGRHYLAMELIAGQRLDDVMRRSGPMSPERLLPILTQLADAVDHAHSRGVVHRDLKPENLILVGHRGRADILKVLDFGVAKIVSPDAADAIALSHKGKIYGTPAFMAPEQFGGEATDRVDLYAIGCIAYTLLTGAPPFDGSLMQLMESHLTEDPLPPSARRTDIRISPELDELILRCLQKQPVDRFRSGRDLMLALERLQQGVARSPSGRRASFSTGVANVETRGRPGATEVNLSGGSDKTMDAGDLSATLPQVAAQRAAEEVVRNLAHQLADTDAADAQMLLALTRLTQLEDELAYLDAQQQALQGLSDDLEEAARAREASMRFALGELRYQRTHALETGYTPDPDVDREIERLEQKVTNVHADLEQQLLPVTDHAITLAAARATLEEESQVLHAELERHLGRLRPTVGSRFPTLFGRLAAIRAAFPSAR